MRIPFALMSRTRYPFGAVLEMEWGSAVLLGRVLDISAEGMRIEIADPLWVGAKFSAVLALEPPLRMECVVRRGGAGGGMGGFLVTPGAEGPGPLSALLRAVGKKKRAAWIWGPGARRTQDSHGGW